ncbi:hypothetical protein KBD45_02385 [Candidatus Dojkabacteria bacterium]|nr:hypothetical protein [Candidatus Dojkabacteria bacterium]
MSKVVIIKLGGSVLSRIDCAFDFEYIKKFKEVLLGRIAQGDKFCIITGGGYTCRMYQKLAKESGLINYDNDLHWIGTTVNVLHAEIVRSVFSDVAYDRPFMYEDFYSQEPLNMEKSVLIGGGSRPGHSGDMDAIFLALKTGADTIVSLKNIDHLYSADPKKDSSAKIIKKTDWNGYFEIIGGKDIHEPGGSYIVDPASAKKAKSHKLKFIVVKGSELENFRNYLDGNDFKGSEIC